MNMRRPNKSLPATRDGGFRRRCAMAGQVSFGFHAGLIRSGKSFLALFTSLKSGRPFLSSTRNGQSNNFAFFGSSIRKRPQKVTKAQKILNLCQKMARLHLPNSNDYRREQEMRQQTFAGFKRSDELQSQWKETCESGWCGHGKFVCVGFSRHECFCAVHFAWRPER